MGRVVSEMRDPQSVIELVKHRQRETTTHLATVDDLIAYPTSNGGMVVEFIIWGKDGRPLESYRINVCPEDADRITEQRRRANNG